MASVLTFIHRPVRSYWGLGPLPVPAGDMVVVGWELPVAPVDDGMPEEVAPIISEALTANARVTFLSSEHPPGPGDRWVESRDDLVRTIPTASLADRVRLRMARLPPSLTQVSSRAPATVAGLFDDPGFPWWMGVSAALLSPASDPPPLLDGAKLLALMDDGWATTAASLRDVGVDAVIRAGVDGDVIGVLSLRPGHQTSLLSSFRAAAERAGLGWAERTEPDPRR